MSTPPTWLKHCPHVLIKARLAEADFVMLLEETATGITTGSVAIPHGPAGDDARAEMERLVAEGLAVRVQAGQKGGPR